MNKHLPDKTNKADRTFLCCSLQIFEETTDKNTKPTFARFYILAKVHKSPLKTRPIVLVSGSITEAIGRWVDKELQKLFNQSRHLFPYFLKSSRELVTDVTKLDLPPNAKIFTCDAVSMYTNIDTTHAFQVITEFIENLPEEVGVHPGLIAGLEIVMKHCVFQFGQEFFLQLTGTAMGAPPAPMYATMYFAIHKNNIIKNFASHLAFYQRYINDGFGIWIDDGNNARFLSFQAKMDSFGKLKWEFSNLSVCTNFLDVHLRIVGNKVTTQLHEKLLNLYLYIPPHSAHPPGVLKSIIYGRIQQINYLCNNATNRTKYTTLLLQ